MDTHHVPNVGLIFILAGVAKIKLDFLQQAVADLQSNAALFSYGCPILLGDDSVCKIFGKIVEPLQSVSQSQVWIV